MKPALFKDMDDYPDKGMGIISDATNILVHEVLNGEYTCSFEVPRTSRFYKKIKPELLVYTAVSKDKKDWFYITSTDIKSSPDIMTVTCNHITTLANSGYIDGTLEIDLRNLESTLVAMKSMLTGQGIVKFNYTTTIEMTVGYTDVSYTNLNPMEIILGSENSLVNVFGARVERYGTTVNIAPLNTGNYIDIRKGKNISGINIQTNIENLTTTIIPYYTEGDDDTGTITPPPDDWNVINVGQNTAGRITVRVTRISAVMSTDYNYASGRSAPRGSTWKATQMRTNKYNSSIVQYKIGTNCWLDKSDIEILN